MKIFSYLSLTVFLLISCNSDKQIRSVKSASSNTLEIKDTTPKVTGIGGVFFKSTNPTDLKKWYSNNLGISIDAYGAPFEFRNANNPDETNYLNWDAFPDTTSYFNPSPKEFMINYRVQNLEGLIDQLKANNVTIVDELATYDYGKFIHIMDSDGNKIELWEPVDSVLATYGRKANK